MQWVAAYNLPGKCNLRCMTWSQLLFISSRFQDVTQKLCFGIYAGLDVTQGE